PIAQIVQRALHHTLVFPGKPAKKNGGRIALIAGERPGPIGLVMVHRRWSHVFKIGVDGGQLSHSVAPSRVLVGLPLPDTLTSKYLSFRVLPSREKASTAWVPSGG